MSTKKNKDSPIMAIEKLRKEVVDAKINHGKLQALLRKAESAKAKRETEAWSDQLILKTLRFKSTLTIEEIVSALDGAAERKKNEVKQ